jgi:hypothetical protein
MRLIAGLLQVSKCFVAWSKSLGKKYPHADRLWLEPEGRGEGSGLSLLNNITKVKR